MKIAARILAGLVILAVVAGGYVYMHMTGGLTSVQAAVKVGEKMPNFTLKDYNGKEHSLKQYLEKDKVVLLEFCSQHCPWSRGTDPHLAELYKQHKDKNFVFLGIDSHKSTSPEDIKEYAKDKKPYPVLKDPKNKYADEVGAKVTPEIFIIDKDGKLRYHGAFDDRTRPDKKGSESHAANALEEVLNGEQVETKESQLWGCTIKRAVQRDE